MNCTVVAQVLSTYDELYDVNEYLIDQLSIFVCTICKSSFKEKSYLTRHLLMHNKINSLKRDKINIKFGGDIAIVATSEENNDDVAIVVTSEESNSEESGSLALPAETDSISCEVCNKNFFGKAKNTFAKHFNAHFNNFECNICLKVFKNNSFLQRHKASHSDNRNFECTVCKSKFKLKDQLLTHTKNRHNNKEFKCGICWNTYKDKNTVSRHLKDRHADRINLKCNECDYYFPTFEEFRSHMNTLHIESEK